MLQSISGQTWGTILMPQPQASYLVCATPRSGSTLLCEALCNTGVAGRPAEYFEALRRSGLPRRPHEYFEDPDAPNVEPLLGRQRHSSVDHLPRREQLGAETYAAYLREALE